ncbi:metallopeptidase [Candidatus Bathyarchaeota archaeon]|jgi:predicted metallopeptidase|nr:metallopeptidase [Candidatus Bathyarchaeota archaeon]MBT4319262.1 metallopeptidase [Candidatus Bathyarchaeota archaeon]MBT4422874.1 metallopeptidase [Candidatus Bathyarchaeota archaeon]MBT6603508.1 metallopeptidase [Candidatus Bathyarchaeota archaeon]MBT7186994.1 metallopeptidase [Candidatus Bathyarchaeota archaeon]
MIQYYDAPDIKKKIEIIVDVLKFDHVNLENIRYIRSRGSKAKRTIARVHGLGRIWQQSLDMEPTYVIEVIHEIFDFYPPEAQDRTLIHEIMHIPHTAKGGFRHHKNYVTSANVDTWHKRYKQRYKELGLDKL